MEDAFARLHLARLCAHVVHSDQSATDVSRDGAPFWQMLCLLASRWVAACSRTSPVDFGVLRPSSCGGECGPASAKHRRVCAARPALQCSTLHSFPLCCAPNFTYASNLPMQGPG